MSRKRHHVPRRTCVGCRAVRERSALIAIRKDSTGALLLMPRRDSGRGAYLCPRLDCFIRAWERKTLVRALGCDAARVDRGAIQSQFEAEVRQRTDAEAGDERSGKADGPEGMENA